MKFDDVDVLEKYEGKDGHRDWAKSASTWLYPGDIICVVSGAMAEEILKAKERQQHEQNEKAGTGKDQ